MVLITPDEGPTGLTTSINALEGQLADMRQELENLYHRIKAGDLDELKSATKATAEIRHELCVDSADITMQESQCSQCRSVWPLPPGGRTKCHLSATPAPIWGWVRARCTRGHGAPGVVNGIDGVPNDVRTLRFGASQP